MGAVYMSYRAKPAPSNDTTHTLQESAPPVATSPSAPPARVIAPAGDGAPTIDVDDLPSVAPQASVGAARSEGQHVAAPPTSTGTPAELFRDANASRRAGEVDKAVELYSALVARHADTPEALAARVSLGRLLLDRRGDAAGALVQFDAYLKSSSSDRALAEEARLGRALVFQRQGLQEEERRAWHELLERHPDSLYASRARERLRVLAPAAAPSSSSP
jgi:tetratricopeptide (TPR) repeat protein